VVIRVVPDLIEVIVLSGDAEALLSIDSSIVITVTLREEYILELVHPGIREQKRWIVRGNERVTRYDRMILLLEKREELIPNLTGRFHEFRLPSVKKSLHSLMQKQAPEYTNLARFLSGRFLDSLERMQK